MSHDDPFFSPGDADRTVIRPIPGGRRPNGQGAASPSPPPSPPPRRQAPADTGQIPWTAGASPRHGDSALVQSATPLLALAGQLRNTVSHPDPDGLRNRLVDAVRKFEADARALGISDAKVLPARYVLCALIDEAVLGTPWGSQSVWSGQGLLITFHNEAWGGEKFYLLLDRLLTNPSENLAMLELLYLCLALGFQGRYQARESGQEQRAQVTERLFQVIRTQRGDPERELSTHWRGIEEQRDPLIHSIPLWVLSAVAAVLLLVLFSTLSLNLNQASDPVFLALRGLDTRLPAFSEEGREPDPDGVDGGQTGGQTGGPKQVREAIPTLRTLLADEIGADRLEIEDRSDGETVVIRGDGLFRSGRVTVRKEYQPVLTRIGQALGQLPGNIIVAGHTDSVPIKTLRFPSNWHLSKERAANVAAELSAITGDPGRYTVKGMGKTEPLLENSEDARNRRVEISLIAP